MAEAEGLQSLAAVSAATSHITMGVGVIPLDARPPAVIAQRLRSLALPLDRLVLGVGSGNSKSSLALVRDGSRRAAGRDRGDGRRRRARPEDVDARGRSCRWGAVQLDDARSTSPISRPTVHGSLMAYVRCALLPRAEARLSAGARALLGARPVREASGAHARDSARHVRGRPRRRRRSSRDSLASRPCSTRRSSARSPPTIRSTASSSSPEPVRRADAGATVTTCPRGPQPPDRMNRQNGGWVGSARTDPAHRPPRSRRRHCTHVSGPPVTLAHDRGDPQPRRGRTRWRRVRAGRPLRLSPEQR